MISGKHLVWGMMLLDLLLAFLAYSLAFNLTYGTFDQFGGETNLFPAWIFHPPFSQGELILRLVLPITWIFSTIRMGLYQSRRLVSQNWEFWDITKAALLTTCIGLIATTFLPPTHTAPKVMWLFCLIVIIFEIICRTTIRCILRIIRARGKDIRYVLIAGRNNRARDIARYFEERPELGYRLLGFADSANSDPTPEVISDLQNLPSFLWDNVVHEVLLCLPVRSFYDEVQKILDVCERQGILVRIIGDLFTSRLGYISAGNLHSHPMLTFSVSKMNGWPIYFKRFFDIAASGVGLIILLPVLVAIAILIKITSRGPILFAQERLGKDKRLFRMLKFRSMVVDADILQKELEHLNEADGAAFKIKNDPRVTKIGKFLRSTSLDELPQLINVFKGEMSLVGPRPLPVRDFTNMDTDVHLRRFSVLPGLTCLWQIEERSFESFNYWMELDMRYIDNWSLLLDFKLLLKTIPAVLKRKGAV